MAYEPEVSPLAFVGAGEQAPPLPPKQAVTLCEVDGKSYFVTPDMEQQQETIHELGLVGSEMIFHPIIVPHNLPNIQNKRKRRSNELHPDERRRKAARPFGFRPFPPDFDRSRRGRGSGDRPRVPRRRMSAGNGSDFTGGAPGKERDIPEQGGRRQPLFDPNQSILHAGPGIVQDLEQQFFASANRVYDSVQRNIVPEATARVNKVMDRFSSWRAGGQPAQASSGDNDGGDQKHPDGAQAQAGYYDTAKQYATGAKDFVQRVWSHPDPVSMVLGRSTDDRVRGPDGEYYPKDDLKHNDPPRSDVPDTQDHRPQASTPPRASRSDATDLDPNAMVDDSFLGEPSGGDEAEDAPRGPLPAHNPMHSAGLKPGNEEPETSSSEHPFNVTRTSGLVKEEFDCPVIAFDCHPVRPELAFATQDDSVSFWDFRQGAFQSLILSNELQRCVSDVKYNPTGTQIAAACNNGVCLWTFRYVPPYDDKEKRRTKRILDSSTLSSGSFSLDSSMSEEMFHRMSQDTSTSMHNTSFEKLREFNQHAKLQTDSRNVWMRFLPQNYSTTSGDPELVSGVAWSACGRHLACWFEESEHASIYSPERMDSVFTKFSLPRGVLGTFMGTLYKQIRCIDEIRFSPERDNATAVVISKVSINTEASRGMLFRRWGQYNAHVVSTHTWDVTHEFSLDGHHVHSVAWHPVQEKFMLALGNRIVQQVQYRSATTLARQEKFFEFPDRLGAPIKEHFPGGEVHLVKWSPDGQRLAVSFKPHIFGRDANDHSELIAVFETFPSNSDRPAQLLGYIRGPPAGNDLQRSRQEFERQQVEAYKREQQQWFAQEDEQTKERAVVGNQKRRSETLTVPLRDSDHFVINYAVYMDFTRSFSKGSLLIVAWLGGQITTYPMIYTRADDKPSRVDAFQERYVRTNRKQARSHFSMFPGYSRNGDLDETFSY